MGIIQIKEIEFDQDSRGWSLKPITDNDMKNGIISDVHIVSMKPGAIRGNHYHAHKTEYILIIGSTCRVVAIDNNTKKKEEKTIEDNSKILLVISPNVTHSIENIGNEISYLLCYSKVAEGLKSQNVVNNKVI